MIRNVADPPIRRLGLALDDDPLFASLVAAVRAAAEDLGLEVADVRAPDDEPGLDRVLIIGRPGRHLPLLSSRPTVPRTIWSGEPLPADGPIRAAVAGPGQPGRAAPRREPPRVGRWIRAAPLGGPAARWRARILADRLVRANLTELAWAASRGAGLVVTSHDRAAVLAGHGLRARVVPFGYHAALAGPLTPPDTEPRDIPVLSLGASSRHLRRGHLLARFAADRAGGPALLPLDGVWGGERSGILRRSRVLLDVHRIPGTFIGVRLILALAAGVAVVTEPMTDPRPFEPGVTHLEVPADDLLDAARSLVADEERRRSMVLAGQALLAERLLLTESVLAVIAGGAMPDGMSGPPR